MKRRHLDFNEYKKEVFLKDPALGVEYKKLQPEFAVIEAIFRARMRKGLTQERVARRMKTKQSAIARLESGSANPSVNFLQRLASALDSRLEIRFLPK